MRSFCKDDMRRRGTVEQLTRLAPRLEPHYTPC